LTGENEVREEALQAAADALFTAEHEARSIEPLTATWPDIEVADAYEIQLRNIHRQLDTGAIIKGHKVGLTARPMQELLGVNEPDYGHLLDHMVVADGTGLAMNRLCSPKVEIEIAFVLGAALKGPGCTLADVLRATEFVMPSIEVVDSRVRDWKITLIDTIADNASSAGVVLGGHAVSPTEIDMVTLGAVLSKNGQVVETGAGAAVLGHPGNAVAWLANKLADFGAHIKAGQIVLPGSCVRAIDAVAGDSFRADFSELGSVSVSFV
tara:strand:- start:1065 stop:1865 length:801 start_codon:yes stop_codon:yes gene_type:complete